MREYLDAIIGAPAAEALFKSLKDKPQLNNNILPMVFHSWLNNLEEYSGLVPGSDSISITINKVNGHFDGFIKSNDVFFPINEKSAWYVSAGICLAVQANPDFNCDDQSLWALKKSLDQLVSGKTPKTVRRGPAPSPKANNEQRKLSIPLSKAHTRCPACGNTIIKDKSFVG